MSFAHQCKTILAVSTLTYLSQGNAEVEDNPAYQDAYQGWAAAHFTLLPTSFLPGPFGTIADLASIPIDVRIKTLPAAFVAHDANAVIPNSPDGCHYDFTLPQKASTYENLFGLADIKTLAQNWGAFSNQDSPWVEHANAEVEVRVDHEYLNDWSNSDKTVIFPSGNHNIKWGAYTQIDPLIDITLPIAIFIASNEIKYLKSFFSLQTDPGTAARAAEIGGLFLINAGIEMGLISASQIESNIPIDSATHEQFRLFPVLDINQPVITTSNPTPPPLEANSFGGELWSVHKDNLRATILATDPCDQYLLVGNDAPFKLPLGTTEVIWEAYDTGPIGGNNPGFATVSQFITVEDTRAPIILAPPSRVIESNVAATTNDFDIGTAVVFDVADPNPIIDNTVGNGFNPDTRTEVLWTATDSSGNSSSKSQWITVKTPGTNTAPTVTDLTANGLTSEHIDLTLSGTDNDFLSGRFDPLKFKITDRPDHGFFVAPLMPYFIEDYRVRPGSVVGDILNNSANPAADLDVVFCDNNIDIPIDFVYSAEFVHVNDNGVSYVLDRYWYCTNGLPVTASRLSKWDADGVYERQIDVPQAIQRITLDDNGFIYTVRPGTSSEPLYLNKYDDQLNSLQSWKLDDMSAFGNPKMLGATMDSTTGLIFATDKRRVYIFDGADGNYVPERLGTLKNAENFLSGVPSVAGSSSRGFYISIDSTGALYIVDSGWNRIHKFNPTSYDGVNLDVGTHIGWMGKCDSGAGCDDEAEHSIGYSCSDATPCMVSDSSGDWAGQFNTPLGMALDDNDLLYVTDYENARVQRFSPLGDFAGEAKSTCDGSCFVLGDMGRPLDISLNATQFFVLDNDRDLMHIFETAPFKEMTENSVVVTYASDNDFQGVDSFSFSADDGLVSSNQAIATIQISRNFRAPEAFDGLLTTDEDTSLPINLLASDPDGIAGIDFNGLDTLSYQIIDQPVYGTIQGVGSQWTYTPNENYNGDDTFTFRVNDGVFDSNSATVQISVNPVNDAPTVAFTDENSKVLPKQLWPLLKNKVIGNNFQAGLGYPVPLMAEFLDPDKDQAHFVFIYWEDGVTHIGSTAYTVEDPENPPDNPIITPNFNGKGQIIADYTFLSPGNQTVGVQVFDNVSGQSETVTADINVIPMVDLTLSDEDTDPDTYPEPGNITSITIDITHVAPTEPIVGINATNVVFTGELPTDVSFIDIQPTQGFCSRQGQISTCQIGTMAPSEVVTLTVTMQPDVFFNPERAGFVIDVSSDEPDASYNNLKVVNIPIKLNDVIFAHGFE
ncbi:MAG: Ig-like domain-containing protein [Marinicella sp.]